jgi:hypothetical protein
LGEDEEAVRNSSAKKQRDKEGRKGRMKIDEPMKKQRKLLKEKSSIREEQQRKATKNK